MRLENYIMEQDINTASVADIFVEQAQAEMNVIASIVESYTKDVTMEQFIQEGAIKDATAVAKGSNYESKIKRVVAFIPRFFAQLFKLIVAKLKKVNNPINAIKGKFSKVPEDVKESAVIPITKENLEYASKCIKEIEKILDRNKFEDLFSNIKDIDGTAKGNGVMLKISEDAEKLAKTLDNYDVEKRIQLSLQIWQNNKDKQEKSKASYGKTVMNVKVDDGSPKSSVSMPDLVMKTPETKDLATIAEFEDFAKDYVEDRESLEELFKMIMDLLNETKREAAGNPEKLKSGVEISSPVSGIDKDFGKYMDMLIKSMNKLSASFTKLFDAIEKGFMNVLKDTKAFKAYKTPKAGTKYNDESLADGYKIDATNTSAGNWGSSRTKSGGDYGREPAKGDTPERIASYYL